LTLADNLAITVALGLQGFQV